MQRIYPTCLEGKSSSYSAEELEQWVLLRRSADAGWKRREVKFTRKHWISRKEVGVTYIDGACIVPGGRWLLVGGGDGSVTTYDLDASILKGSLLISPDEDEQPVHHMAIEMDYSKETSNLTFTMALSANDTLYFGKLPHHLNVKLTHVPSSFSVPSEISHLAGHFNWPQYRGPVNGQSPSHNSSPRR